MRRNPLVLLPLLLALPGCGSDSGPTHPHSGELHIAFASNRLPSLPSGSDIYFFDLATAGPPTMPPNVDTPYTEFVPAFSGNGEWMAYNTDNASLVGFPVQLLLYHVRTAEIVVPRAPLPFLNPWNPSLSYDGRYLAFQTQIGSYIDLDIALMDAVADTIIPTPRLHAYGAADFDPALSGDGKLIAFTTTRWGSYDVALYSVAGDSLLALPGLDTPSSEMGVSISRDGRYLAFQSNRPGGVGIFDIYVYDRQTSSLVPLPGANSSMSETIPSISPDGRYVAYETDAEGGGDIRLYDIALQQPVPLSGLNDPYFFDKSPALSQTP